MKIKRFVGGSLESNGYVIYQKSSGPCYVIDPGYNPKKYINYINEEKLICKGIILTHLHHDHVGAAEAVSDAFDVPIMMHEADAFVYGGRVDIFLKDGMEILLEDEILKIISTPGHTKGSICIMASKSRVCFTGDTIFDTDLGRSDLTGGSEVDMINTVLNICDRWDNDIYIYPGHDDSCTMKKVRIYNTEFNSIKEGNQR